MVRRGRGISLTEERKDWLERFLDELEFERLGFEYPEYMRSQKDVDKRKFEKNLLQIKGRKK